MLTVFYQIYALFTTTLMSHTVRSLHNVINSHSFIRAEYPHLANCLCYDENEIIHRWKGCCYKYYYCPHKICFYDSGN